MMDDEWAALGAQSKPEFLHRRPAPQPSSLVSFVKLLQLHMRSFLLRLKDFPASEILSHNSEVLNECDAVYHD